MDWLTRSMKQDKVAVHGVIVKKQPLPIRSMPLPPTMLIWRFHGRYSSGYNLTDELAYNHASVLKQFASSADVEIGSKFDF